jgi:hypothetical protein
MNGTMTSKSVSELKFRGKKPIDNPAQDVSQSRHQQERKEQASM